jgi:signal transduction histidine kinase
MIIQLPASGRPFLAARSGLREELDEEETFECQVAAREVVETGVVTETSLVSGRVALLAPLRAQLTLPGALVIVHADRPDAEEPVLLASFADHAGLVLDRTQALEDRQKLAVISDRDRIARDLHDVVIQRLFASGLKLHSTVALADDAALRERLESTVRDLDQTIRDIRSSIFDLTSRPRSSVRSDLADLVRDLVPALGFAPSVHMTGAVDKAIDPKLQEQLGSVIREALTNVAKHAGATAASVELQLTPTHLRLRVSDDGVGMPEGRPERGLRTIRRRAVLLGGDLDLWPNDPRGTSLVWAVPLPQEP